MPLAAGSAPLTEAQLAAVAKTLAAEVPTLTEDTSEQSTGVWDEETKVSSGGPVCKTFVNALQGYAAAYGSSAEVDRNYSVPTTIGKETVEVFLVSHTSAADAHRRVEDTRTSSKSCPHTTAMADDVTMGMNTVPLDQPVMGDDSTVVRIGLLQSGKFAFLTTAMTQVDNTTVNITLLSVKAYEPGVVDQLTKQVVTILRKAHTHV
jgi:hypothetical protein